MKKALKKIWQEWREGGWEFNLKRIALFIVVLALAIVFTNWPEYSYTVLVGSMFLLLLRTLTSASFARGVLKVAGK